MSIGKQQESESGQVADSGSTSSKYFWDRTSSHILNNGFSPRITIPTIALVGTPNSGKSSLFNGLTGLSQHVGNFPGVTVERKSADISNDEGDNIRLIDLPGVDTLYPGAEDEQITADILRQSSHPDHPQAVVCVVDATQLKRGLVLCTQIIDLGLPIILALNMMDLIKEAKQEINVPLLSSYLDIPIIPISARKGTGIQALNTQLFEPINPSTKKFFTIPIRFHDTIQEIKAKLPLTAEYAAYQALIQPQHFSGFPIWEAESARKQAGISDQQANELISNELLIRKDRMSEISAEVISSSTGILAKFTNQLDQVLIHKFWGYLIFGLIMLVIFQAIFAWASYPQDLIDAGISGLIDLLQTTLPSGWVTNLLTDGIITGFGGIIVFIPQIAFLFLFIAVMEETGYMARVVFLMDRIMRPFGFSGKSIIPLMGGMACAIPSIMMARSIPNKYERLITILVTPLMSCSARIPVYTLLIAMFIPAQTIMGLDQRGLIMTGLYFLGFVSALGMAFVFKKIMNYQSDGIFLMEMPIYRMPRWKNVGITVWQKSMDFVFGAGKIILGITIILWFLTAYGPKEQMQAVEQTYEPLFSQENLSESTMDSLQIAYGNAHLEATYAAQLGKVIEPVIRPLGFDWKIGISLITSFAAREVFVGTMSIIYGQANPEEFDSGEEQISGRKALIERMQQERWEHTGEKVYTPATVFALIIYYVFAMQCMSTLAVTRREIGWFWAIIMLLYLSVLGYVGAFITYQLFSI